MKKSHLLAAVLFGVMAIGGLVVGLLFLSRGETRPAVTMLLSAAGLAAFFLIASSRI